MPISIDETPCADVARDLVRCSDDVCACDEVEEEEEGGTSARDMISGSKGIETVLRIFCLAWMSRST